MTTFNISKGSHLVRIVEEGGRYTSRLYVNHGETATLTVHKAWTMAGAARQAVKMLAAHLTDARAAAE